jgi:hypothetical protein
MKKQFITEAARMQKLAGIITEADTTPAKTALYNNATLHIYSDDDEAYITDNTGEEFPGSIDGDTATFWITGIEDPYYDETREENWDFPEVFKQMLEAGGDYTLSTGYEGYEINLTIDLDTLKTLYPVEYK